MAIDGPLERSPIEADEKLLERVTEALRAGPGTLAWERVLEELSVGSGGRTSQAAADPDGVRAETELLLRVRERLAMGRSWREVQAGEGFTRKLMQRIDQQPQASGTAVTLWIFLAAMLAVAAVVGWAFVAWLRSASDSPAAGVETDRGPATPSVVSYGSPRVTWLFGRPWPAETLLAGGLPTEADGDGWRPARGRPTEGATASEAGRADDGPAGAMALLTTPLPLNGLSVIEAEFDAPVAIDPQLAVHIVLTPSTDVDARLASRPGGGEWVWQWQASGLSLVHPDTSVTLLRSTPAAAQAGRRTLLLQLSDRGRSVVVSVDGEVLHRGPTGLTGSGELFVGVRFVARGELRQSVPGVRALRVYDGR